MTKTPTIKWPASDVRMVNVDGLVPYARNARTHSDEQVAQLCASIREWGWTVPILLDEESGIIAGHGRVMAARKLGLKEVPAMVAEGWSEAQRRAYVLADNKLALNAGWDDALLAEELRELDGLGFDLDLTGFDTSELDAFGVESLDNESGSLGESENVEIGGGRFLLQIEYENEQDLAEAYQKTMEDGLKCVILT